MKTKHTFGALLAAAAVLGVSNAPAQAQMMDDRRMMGNYSVAAPDRIRAEMAENLDRLFLLHAADGNMLEVMSGRLALQKSRNAGVRQVAQTTVRDHATAQRDLRTHFQRMNMMMPTKLSVPKQAQYDALRRLSGSAFDKAYMAAQVGGHEATVVLFSHELHAGRDAGVQAHARNKLPKILMHTGLIYEVAQQVGAPGIEMRPADLKALAVRGSMNNMEGGMMMGNYAVASADRIGSEMTENLDRLFLIHTADSNMFEVMAAKLAMQRTNNASVRTIANATIRGHSIAQRDLRAQFDRMNMMMPTKLSVSKQAQYDALRRLSGSAFDKAYVATLVSGHETAVVLFSHELDAGQNAQVQAHARNKLPNILMHTGLIYEVAQRTNAPGIEMRPADLKALASVQTSGRTTNTSMAMDDDDASAAGLSVEK